MFSEKIFVSNYIPSLVPVFVPAISYSPLPFTPTSSFSTLADQFGNSNTIYQENIIITKLVALESYMH